MKFNDAVFGAVFLALSLLVLWSIQGYPKIPGQNIGPAAFPGLVSGLLALCSLLLIIKGLRERNGDAWFVRGAWSRQLRQLVAFAVTVGALALYVAAAEKIGFLILGPVMLVSMMLALKVRPGLAVIVALVATFVIHIAFYKFLRVPLPWGLLPVLY
jgi:putative tricarboxylic transport membrane protein